LDHVVFWDTAFLLIYTLFFGAKNGKYREKGKEKREKRTKIKKEKRGKEKKERK
jgi:hypothetical protein